MELGTTLATDAGRQVVTCEGRLSLLDEQGAVEWTIEHPPWDGSSCAFSEDGSLLWATMPGLDHPWQTDEDADEQECAPDDDGEGEGFASEGEQGGTDAEQSAPGPLLGGDEVWVIEAATGRVLATSAFGTCVDAAAMVRHPDGVHMGLGTYAHDGPCATFWGRYTDGRLHLAADPLPGHLMDVNAAGTAYLTLDIDVVTTSGQEGGETLAIRAFPTHDVLAQRAGNGHLTPGERFAWAKYLDDERILVDVNHGGFQFRQMLYDARDLTCLGEADAAAAP
ncbi:hypothetical protein ACFYZ4_25990 [Streptomyces sp. NPDC001513]|uniref:hypothetical protein n=1 Tax=Streptomyces sp. NPDC001513 TaxID=3364580 RepID=UPI0036C37D58